MNATQVRHWRRDPIAFVSDVLRDPDSDGRPFELYAEEEAFLREALTLTPGGSLPYSELLYSAPKKSGKTAIGAISMLYVIVALCGRYAEGYCLANDEEQAQGRVFQACGKIIECSPLLKDSAKIAKGSGVPNKEKVGTVTRAQLRTIAERKLPDLNSNSIEAAERIVMGTARSMGVDIVD